MRKQKTKHKSILILTCIGFVLILAACNKDLNNVENKANSGKNEVSGTAVKVSNSPELQIEVKVTPTPLVTVASTKKPVEGKGLLENIPKNIDTTRQSWYVIRNSKHETPTVNQKIKKMIEKYNGIYSIKPEIKKIYLTFDEGYENGYTQSILDTLKSKNIKATFFVTGQYLKAQKKLIQRMIDEGHGVENHTMNHPSLPHLDEKTFENEVLGVEKLFKEEFGGVMKYLRPPKGEYNEKVLYMLNSLGYKTAFWGFAYDDFDVNKQKGTEYAHKKIMDNLHSGEIMLLHAVSKDNANVLPGIIDEVRGKGYEIGKLE